MLPEETITITLDSTIQHYIQVADDNKYNTERHFKMGFRGLCINQQNEQTASDFLYN